jgi:hypothetical protein
MVTLAEHLKSIIGGNWGSAFLDFAYVSATRMSLRLLSAAAAFEYYLSIISTGVGAVACLVTACIYMAPKLDFEDALPAAYMLFVLVAAMGLFLPDEYPMRVRTTAVVIVLVAGVSAAVACGLVVCCVLGMVHWLELVIFTPPFLLAVLLLRVACRRLKNKVVELERKYYTLDDDEHEQRGTAACPVCGFRDEPKTNHKLWEGFYDAGRRAFRPGLLYNSVLGKYVCGLVISGECSAGPFEHSRDLAEHLLGVHWGDGFHCPGCLRSLRRVRCGGGGGGIL